MSDPPPEPQPQPEDCRTLIRSPNRVFRWMQGTGEFNDQPISPSNNVPNSPPSGNQYVLDDGVNLRSPSVGFGPQTSPPNVFAAAFTQENMQNNAGITENNQQPNQETSNASPSQALVSQELAEYHEFLGELEQRNAYHLRILRESSQLRNSEDNAHRGIHDGNHHVEDPYNSTAFQNINNYAANMMFINNFTSQPRYDGSQPPGERAHQTDLTTVMMNTINNHFSQPHYGGLQPPGQRAHQTDMATGMVNTMVVNSSQPRYGGVQPPSQRAHQMDMTTGMMNPMNNHQGGINGQVSENNLVPTQHTNHENVIVWGIPQYQEDQRNDHMLHNNNMSPTQQAVQSSGDHMLTNDLPSTTVILDRFEDTPYINHPDPYDEESSNDDDEDEDVSHSSLTTPSQWALQQYIAQHTQSPVPDTTSDYASDQRTPGPGPVGTGLDVPDVPDNMPQSQHIVHSEQELDVANVLGNMLPNQHLVHNEQGDMPASGGDEMDTTDDQIPFDTAQPFNAINSGPLLPQDAISRQTLQLDSNPMPTSNVEETGAALDSGEVDTRSAMDLSPDISDTLASNVHQPQMETPQASHTFTHLARNEKSDTRKDSSRGANRVKKSIRRRKPAKSQKLLSAIASSASQLLEESASQGVEAQDESESSVESVE